MDKIEKVTLGLVVLKKYPGAAVNAYHDQLFAGPDANAVSAEDAALLTTLGWFVDEESWSIFT